MVNKLVLKVVKCKPFWKVMKWTVLVCSIGCFFLMIHSIGQRDLALTLKNLFYIVGGLSLYKLSLDMIKKLEH